MKTKIALCLLLLSGLPILPAHGETLEKSVQLAGQWPAYYWQTKTIALDSARGLVFAADGGEQIMVLDTDLNPIATFRVTDSAEVAGLYYRAEESLLYAACVYEGLHIIDVSDPYHPSKTGVYLPDDTAATLNSVHVADSNAYVSSWISGQFYVLDVADSSNPSLLHNIELPGAVGLAFPMDIHVSAGYIWVADTINGVHLVDVSNPTNLKNLLILPGARDMAADGDYLYVTLESNGLEIVDISDPETISVESEVAHYDPEGSGNERAIRVNGDLAYLAYEATGIQVIDVSNKAEPITDPAWSYTGTGAYSIALLPEQNSLYLTGSTAGLQKIDVTDKANMVLSASYDTPADALAIDVSSGYLYMVDDIAGDDPSAEGLRILEISYINTAIVFFLTGFCATPGTALDVVVTGDYACVADGDAGLVIINAFDKTNPEIIGGYDTAGSAQRVFTDGSAAYIADGDAGLVILDITDKSQPQLIASLDTSGFASDVYLTATRDYACIADGPGGLAIVDIRNPAAPEITGTLAIEGGAQGVYAYGTLAYVAAGDQGLAVIGIADPAHPKKIASLNTPGNAARITLTADFAYIADGNKGLCVVNVDDPAHPVKDSDWSYDSSGNVTDVFSGYSVDENLYAFIADGPSGVSAIRLYYEEDENGSGTDTGGGGGGGCFIESLR
jgi:hypothetical protein